MPVTVIDLAAIVRSELAENVARLDFTETELVDIGRAIEPILRRPKVPSTPHPIRGKSAAPDFLAARLKF